jgi:hypothetical protein
VTSADAVTDARITRAADDDGCAHHVGTPHVDGALTRVCSRDRMSVPPPMMMRRCLEAAPLLDEHASRPRCQDPANWPWNAGRP